MGSVFSTVDVAVQSVVKGRFTTQQVLIAVAAVILAIVAAKLIKGIVKAAVLVGGVLMLVVYFGLATPTQLKDMASGAAEKIGQEYQTISQSVDVEDGKVYVRIQEKRLPLSEIVSYKKTMDGKLHILTADGTYTSEDEHLFEFLKSLSKEE